MNAATEFDLGPLTWVKGEIDAALDRAGEALLQFHESRDVTKLKFCRTHIHQVHGALSIVGLDGVTQVTETLEGLLAALEENGEVSDDELAAVERVISAIRQYLDDLMAGEPNQPLRLLPVYRALNDARGNGRFRPSDLFFPDLTVRPPKRTEPVVRLSPEDFRACLKRERMRFQKGLLAFLRNPGRKAASEGLAQMQEALKAIEATQETPAARTFWWVSQGLLESLSDQGVAAEQEVKQLCARIDLQIRRLLEGSRNVAERLLRDALYYIGQSNVTSSKGVASAVRDSFQLETLIPAAESVQTTAPQEGALRRLREVIVATEEFWNKFCAGSVAALAGFADQAKNCAQITTAVGHKDLERLGQGLAMVSAWLAEQPTRQNDTVAMEVATAILLLQNAQENFKRLGADFSAQVSLMSARLNACVSGKPLSADEDVPLLDEVTRRAQEKLLITQVAREIQSNLGQIEEALDAFFRDPGQGFDAGAMSSPIRQISGALSILGHDKALQSLQECDADIRRFGEAGYRPSDEDFEAVAQKLSTLGFFVDSLQTGANDFDLFVRKLRGEDVRTEEPAGDEEATAVTGSDVTTVASASPPENKATSSNVTARPEPEAISVEQELKQKKEETKALLAALQQAPEDETLKRELKQNLQSLQADADLLADHDLGENAKAALSALEAGGSAASQIGAAMASTLKDQVAQAPVPTEETLKLAAASHEEIDAELLEIFLEEAQEVLANLSSELEGLRSQPHDVDTLTNIRRASHTLKGSGRMVGLKDLGEVAWEVEQTLNMWLRQELDVTPALLDMIETARDLFVIWVHELKENTGKAPQTADLVALAGKLRGLEPSGDEAVSTAAVVPEPELPSQEAIVLEDFSLEEAGYSALEEKAEGLPDTLTIDLIPEAGLGSEDAVDAQDAAVQEIEVDIEPSDLSVVGGGAEEGAVPELAAVASESISAAEMLAPQQKASEDEFEFDLSTMPTSSGTDEEASLAIELPLEKEVQGVAEHGMVDQGMLVKVRETSDVPPVIEFQLGDLPEALAATQDVATAAVAQLSEVALPVEAEAIAQAAKGASEDLTSPDSGNEFSFSFTVGEDEAEIREQERVSCAELEEGAQTQETEAVAPLKAVFAPEALGSSSQIEERLTEAVPEKDEAVSLTDNGGVDTACIDENVAGGGELATTEDERAATEESPQASGIPQTLYDIFCEEARQHLNTLNKTAAEITADPRTPTSFEMTRAAHTLGGIAATVGLMPINKLAIALEHALLRRDHCPQLDSIEGIEIVRQTVLALEDMFSGLSNQIPPESQPVLLDSLERIFAIQAPLPEPEIVTPEGSVPSEPVDFVAEESTATGEKTAAQLDAQIGTVVGVAALLQDAPKLKDELDDQLLPIFLEEAQDLVQGFAERIHAWREHVTDTEAPRALARLLHTFKGGARMAGAMNLGEMTHLLETGLEDALRGGQLSLPLLEQIESGCDTLTLIVERLMAGESPELPVAAPAPAAELAEATQQPSATIPSEVSAAPLATAESKRDSATPTTPAAAAAEHESADRRSMIRVRADLVDRLVNEAGELSIARARIEGEMRSLKTSLLDLTENIIRLRRQLREIEIQSETQMQARVQFTPGGEGDFDPLELDRFTRFQELTRFMAESVNDVATVQQGLLKNLDDTNAAVVSQARMTRSLQQNLMSIRMVPFNSQSERLYRIVRQTGKELGKRANLDIRGGHIELDRSVLDKIMAPIEHMLRNAINHGIESKEERKAAGKPEVGDVTLTLSQEGNEIVLSMADDGRGLDVAKIRERAISRGLLAPDQEISEAGLYEFIFHPGFSTADSVTQIAGRGVGMDVVKSEVLNLGGRIEILSASGRGTNFRLYLPLTMTVMQGLLVRAAGTLYAVPSTMIEQVLEVKEEKLHEIRSQGAAEWKGNVYPYHFLPHMLSDSQALPETRRRYWILLLRAGAKRVAVLVDELQGNHELVIKNMGEQLSRVVGLAGATVLGDGRVVLILNPVALSGRQPVTSLSASAAEPATVAPSAEEIEAATMPTVLVVDDSLTVRKITGRLLAREGYQVITAKDGVDALEHLVETVPDVMISDVEMPRMDGFDLVRNVRADPRLLQLPIIMITSRTAEKHRNYALEIGANDYLGKPYEEEKLLELIAGYVRQRRQS